MKNIHEVTHEHMEALQALAGVTLKISEARDTLAKIKENETEYLNSREKEALSRVEKVLSDSQELLDEADKNYEQIIQLAKVVTDCAAFLVSVHDGIVEYGRHFDAFVGSVERHIASQQKEIADARQSIRTDRVKLENERKNMDTLRASLTERERKLNDDRAALDRKINRFKEGKL